MPSWIAWIATSDYALAFDAVAFVVALLIASVDRLATWLPFLKPYTTLARPASYCFLALLMLFGGYRWADESAELKSLRNELAAARIDLTAAQTAAARADQARNELAARAITDEQRIADYAEALKQRPNGACLLTPDDFTPGGAARRLRH